MDLNYHGTDSTTGRRLLSLNIEKPSDLVPPLKLGSERFVCLLAWDAGNVEANEIGAFVGIFWIMEQFIFAAGVKGASEHTTLSMKWRSLKGLKKALNQ